MLNSFRHCRQGGHPRLQTAWTSDYNMDTPDYSILYSADPRLQCRLHSLDTPDYRLLISDNCVHAWTSETTNSMIPVIQSRPQTRDCVNPRLWTVWTLDYYL